MPIIDIRLEEDDDGHLTIYHDTVIDRTTTQAGAGHAK